MLYHLTKLALSEESAWVLHSNAPYSRNLPIERLFWQVIVMRWNPVQSGNSQTGQKLKLNILFRIAPNRVEWYVSSLNSTFNLDISISQSTSKLNFYWFEFCQQPCLVGNTRSHSNTEVRQNWALIVLGWETAWELQVQLVWVWILMLLQDEGTVSMWPPLMVVKPRCPSQVEHLQRVQLVFILQQISQLRISLLQPVSFFYFRLQIKLLYSPLHDSWLLFFCQVM